MIAIMETHVLANSTNKRMKDEIIGMLNDVEWNYFCTFTTSYDISFFTCHRLMYLYFKRLKKYDAEMFWAAEKFPDRNSYHIHALLKVPHESKKVKALGTKYYEQVWGEVSGNKRNRSLVEVFDHSKKEKASEYILKEISFKDDVKFNFYK